MNAHINAAGHVIVNDRYTNLLVNIQAGYQIIRTERPDKADTAGKVAHLLGKRIVLQPKKDSQITEADFLAAVDAAA